jgi:hypothetical protein
MKTVQIFRWLNPFFAILLLIVPTFTKSQEDDLLLYFDKAREPWGITAYNAQTDEKLYLSIYTELDHIATSGDGHIAYIQENDVWVLDVLNSPNEPIRITDSPTITEFFLSWTPDGKFLQFETRLKNGLDYLYRYDGTRVLVVDIGTRVERHWTTHGWFVAFQDDSSSWYVWNGQAVIPLDFPLLSDEVLWENFFWTTDNHLFITFGYDAQDYGLPIGRTQIFYWDGAAVHEVIRPSESETFMLGEWSIETDA